MSRGRESLPHGACICPLVILNVIIIIMPLAVLPYLVLVLLACRKNVGQVPLLLVFCGLSAWFGRFYGKYLRVT